MKKTQTELADAMAGIGENIHTQNNRCTSDPMFCVQVCDRIGPIMEEYGNGDLMFHDHRRMETYYEDRPDPDRWKELYGLHKNGDLPGGITAACYVEKWFTVQVCFTEDGCKRHLEMNGHNYRQYYGTRIYVESFHRNPEMQDIREFLMHLARPDESAEPRNMTRPGKVGLLRRLLSFLKSPKR